jgi:hypothetical protein
MQYKAKNKHGPTKNLLTCVEFISEGSIVYNDVSKENNKIA